MNIAHRTRSTETSPANLEAIAHEHGLTIDLPPADGGWARVVTPAGERFHAWVAEAVAS